MAIGKTNAGSGGLNVKVVGGSTWPSTGRYGMIWAHVDTVSPKYVISPTEPVGAAEGMVWIVCGSGEVCVAVDRKQTVRVALTGCHVYTGGAWEECEAWLYDTKWTQFGHTILYLYLNGDSCASVSGGWSGYAYSYDGHSTIQKAAPGITNTDADCTISLTGAGVDLIRQGSVFSGNAIDVSNYATLSLDIVRLPTAGKWTFGLSEKKEHPYTFAVSAEITQSTEKKLVNLDIESLTGKYYVVLCGSVSWSTATSKLTIDQIYMTTRGQSTPSETLTVTTAGDTLIVDTSMAVRTDGDAIIIGGG